MVFNRFKTFILLAMLTALMLFVGSMLGGTFGLIIAFFFVIIFNFASYFWSHKIVLAMYKAKEIKKSDNEKLYNMVKELAHRAKIPMPKLYLIPSQQANAFATGRNPKHGIVAVTQGIMHILNDEELRGVIAHEISHIKNRDILIQTVAAMIAGVISYIATMAQWAAIFGGFGRDDDNNIIELIVLAILTPIIATIIQLAISRSREYLADETGARIAGSPEGLAKALEKIERSVSTTKMPFGNETTSNMFISNPFKSRSLLNLFSTHPSTADRINKLNNLRI